MKAFRSRIVALACSPAVPSLSTRVCPVPLRLAPRLAHLAYSCPQLRAFGSVPSRHNGSYEAADPEADALAERELWLTWRENTLRETLAAAYSDGLLHGDYEHAVEIALKCAVNLTEEHITGNVIPYLLKVAKNDASLLAKVCLVLMRDIHARTDVGIVLHGLTYYREPLSVIWAVQGLLARGMPYLPQNLTEGLAELAKQGQIPQAVVLYGRVLQAQGHDERAVKYFRKAVALSKPVPRQWSLDSLYPPSEPQPWECLGGALADLEGTYEALLPSLLDGALLYDHSRAYHALGRAALHRKEYKTAEENLMKSAMAGNFEDCYYLGILSMRKAFILSKTIPKTPFDDLPTPEPLLGIPFVGHFLRKTAAMDCILHSLYWLEIGHEAGIRKASLAYACVLHKWVPGGREVAWSILMAMEEGAEKGLADKLRSQWNDSRLGYEFMLNLVK